MNDREIEEIENIHCLCYSEQVKIEDMESSKKVYCEWILKEESLNEYEIFFKSGRREKTKFRYFLLIRNSCNENKKTISFNNGILFLDAIEEIARI